MATRRDDVFLLADGKKLSAGHVHQNMPIGRHHQIIYAFHCIVILSTPPPPVSVMMLCEALVSCDR